ncbi:MAG: carboxypeptidase regulatory-like domain-containing protein [Holophagales bacterium]|nr:carboxypeptidase regulatory-like domain-containing protein [Holophagales bacterium]
MNVCAVGPSVRVCWAFSEPPPSAILEAPPVQVSVEGPEHGPVSCLFADLAAPAVLVVPRKAIIRLKPGPQPATLSLYSLGAPDLRKPSHRWQEVAGEVRIPAGRWLASVSVAGLAPRLALVNGRPGSTHELVRPLGPGWSAVLLVSDREGKPVGGSLGVVDAEAAPETGRSPRAERFTDGVGILNGLGMATARMTITSPGFLPETPGAMAAAPGTFTVKSVTLRRGGRLELTVTRDAEPARGARCLLLEPPLHPERNLRLRTIAEGTCDSDGRFVRDGLAPRRYILRVFPMRDGPSFDDSINIADETTLSHALDLVPVSVDGRVTRAEKALEGFSIRASRVFPGESPDEGADVVASSDESGRYEMNLWSEGSYWFVVTTPSGQSAAQKREWIPRSGKRVDFELLGVALAGRVLDGNSVPVQDAVVALRDQTGFHRLARTDGEGTFTFLFDKQGQVSLFADKEGYRRSPTLDVQIPDHGSIDPIEIRLLKDPSLRGRLERVPGVPAPGVSVASVDPLTGAAAQGAVTSADGTFELRATGSVTRVFMTGPGCALAARDVPLPPESAEGAVQEPVVLSCATGTAGLVLQLRNPAGAPMAGEPVRLRLGGRVVPDDVLARHQQWLGLGAATDSAGRIDALGLESGAVEVYLARGSSPQTIGAGLPNGLLLRQELPPGSLFEATITVEPTGTRITP